MVRVNKLIVSDGMHCLQASYRMVVEAFTGTDPGLDIAEFETGFVPGHGTWQFRAMLSLANRGLYVVDHEELNTTEFLSDPEEAIKHQVQDEAIAAKYIADTDLSAEVEALRQCLNSQNVTFIESAPSLEDLRKEIQSGRLLICNVNLQVLEDKEGHTGHYVVVQDINDNFVWLHDPAPPGRFNEAVPLTKFKKAWMDPSERVANFISIAVAAPKK
jgi:hypothetical protein